MQKMRAVDKKLRMTAVVATCTSSTRRRTPRPRWIVHETIRPLVLPGRVVTRVHKDCVCDDKHEWTMAEWLATFPRAKEDAIDVVITHEDERCVLAHAGDVVFCFSHDRAVSPAAVASPVVVSRKRKA